MTLECDIHSECHFGLIFLFSGKKLKLDDVQHLFSVRKYFKVGHETDLGSFGTDTLHLCGLYSSNLALIHRYVCLLYTSDAADE